MKEHPILFSTEMVKAILEGRKSMTRRVIKPQPISCVVELKEHSGVKGYWIPYSVDSKLCNNSQGNRKNDCGYYCRYQIGDRLWVRETFATEDKFDDKPMSFFDKAGDVPIWYKANEDGLIDYVLRGKWRPSIFMPRWASRITLEITSIRVERVQDISEPDTIKEGIIARSEGIDDDFPAQIRDFRYLWDSINSKRGYSWESNPFVWVIGFKQV